MKFLQIFSHVVWQGIKYLIIEFYCVLGREVVWPHRSVPKFQNNCCVHDHLYCVMRQAPSSSKTSLQIYETTRRHISEDGSIVRITNIICCNCLFKIKSAYLIRYPTITYIIISILVWLHVSVPSQTILRPKFNSIRYYQCALYIMGSHTVYRVCVKTIIRVQAIHSFINPQAINVVYIWSCQ